MWIPPAVERELRGNRQAHNAQVLEVMELGAKLEAWRKELRAIDPYLDLVKAKENAAGVPGLKPGYYHVLRRNPGAPWHVMVIETEDGGFKEPDSSLFDMLRGEDCWNDDVRRDREEYRDRARRSRDRMKAREREEREDEFNERLKALENPGVSFTRTGRPWTHRAGAQREARV